MTLSVFKTISLPLVKSFSIDQIGMVQWSLYGLLAILAQTKFIVTSATFLLILYTRSMHFVYFVVGSCLTTLLAKALKRAFRQPRPHGLPGYGMPSTHSQAIAFFAAYFQCVTSAARNDDDDGKGLSWLVVNGVTLFALAVLWSRVRLQHHTVAQVLVGGLLGVLSALLWYSTWLTVIKPHVRPHTVYLFDKKLSLLE